MVPEMARARVTSGGQEGPHQHHRMVISIISGAGCRERAAPLRAPEGAIYMALRAIAARIGPHSGPAVRAARTHCAPRAQVYTRSVYIHILVYVWWVPPYRGTLCCCCTAVTAADPLLHCDDALSFCSGTGYGTSHGPASLSS